MAIGGRKPSDPAEVLWQYAQFCVIKSEKLPTTRVSEGLSVWLNNISPPYAPVAQMVEQLTLNQWVAGSSPSRRTHYLTSFPSFLCPPLAVGIFFSDELVITNCGPA